MKTTTETAVLFCCLPLQLIKCGWVDLDGKFINAISVFTIVLRMVLTTISQHLKKICEEFVKGPWSQNITAMTTPITTTTEFPSTPTTQLQHPQQHSQSSDFAIQPRAGVMSELKKVVCSKQVEKRLLVQ